MIGQIEDLNQCSLFTALRGRVNQVPLAREYVAAIESSFSKLHLYLDEIRRYYPHYTDHSIRHSLRILLRIGTFLSDEQVSLLTTPELYLLVASALVHDIGMTVSDTEAKELLDDPAFVQRYWSHGDHGDRTFQNQAIGELLHGVGRLWVADWIRVRHGVRAKLLLKTSCLPLELLTCGESPRKEFIGRLAESHTLPMTQVLDQRLLPTDALLDECRVNLRFLSFCLRIGDLLDINTSRACPVLRQLSEPLPSTSTPHWDQYREIQLHDPRYGSDVIVSGTCPTQDAHRTLKEWLRWLSEEISCAVTALNTSDLRDPQYHIRLGRVFDQVQPCLTPSGLPAYELLEFRFNLDEQRVFERLLGERLYGRPILALRELIQNAIDAIRFRVAYELQLSAGGQRVVEAPEIDDLIARRIDEFKITITLANEADKDDSDTRCYLSISDRGIGMSRDVIRDYLLKVGRSRWSEDARVSHLCSKHVGEFGIGFLSTFMIADRITIDTRSAMPDEAPLRAHIRSWHEYIGTEPSTRKDVGTTIRLRLRENLVDEVRAALSNLRSLTPSLEVPIEVITAHDESYRVAPRRISNEHDSEKSNRVFTFLWPHLNSKSLITVASQPDGHAGDRSLCQDGLTVPDVPAPSGYELQYQLLRDYNICLDLRGDDRWSLDLSRNLVRGDSRSVWLTLIPRIWSSLIASTELWRFTVIRELVSELATLEFVCFNQRARIWISSEKGLGELSASMRDFEGDLVFLNPLRPGLNPVVSDCSAILLPDQIRVDLYPKERQRDIKRARKARGVPVNAPMPVSDDYDDYDDYGYESDRSLEGATSEITGGWAIKWARGIFSRVLESQRIKYAAYRDEFVKFSAKKSSGSELIGKLGLMCCSNGWISVRAPRGDRWHHVPVEYVTDLVSYLISKHVSWEHFVVILLTTTMRWQSDLFTGWWAREYPQLVPTLRNLETAYRDVLMRAAERAEQQQGQRAL